MLKPGGDLIIGQPPEQEQDVDRKSRPARDHDAGYLKGSSKGNQPAQDRRLLEHSEGQTAPAGHGPRPCPCFVGCPNNTQCHDQNNDGGGRSPLTPQVFSKVSGVDGIEVPDRADTQAKEERLPDERPAMPRTALPLPHIVPGQLRRVAHAGLS